MSPYREEAPFPYGLDSLSVMNGLRDNYLFFFTIIRMTTYNCAVLDEMFEKALWACSLWMKLSLSVGTSWSLEAWSTEVDTFSFKQFSNSLHCCVIFDYESIILFTDFKFIPKFKEALIFLWGTGIGFISHILPQCINEICTWRMATVSSSAQCLPDGCYLRISHLKYPGFPLKILPTYVNSIFFFKKVFL